MADRNDLLGRAVALLRRAEAQTCDIVEDSHFWSKWHHDLGMFRRSLAAAPAGEEPSPPSARYAGNRPCPSCGHQIPLCYAYRCPDCGVDLPGPEANLATEPKDVAVALQAAMRGEEECSG